VLEREHAEAVIRARCAAETAGDRDTWSSLFAPDGSLEQIGTSPAKGFEALGAFFDANVAPLDMHLHEVAAPIVVAEQTIAFCAYQVGRGADQVVLDRAVDHFAFDDDGRVRAVRAFVDVGSTRPDPA
jgi:hypothetical protein